MESVLTEKTGQRLGARAFDNIIFQNQPFLIDEGELGSAIESYQFLLDFAQNKIIYGINTGFGPMAQYKVSKEDQVQLQYNLIRSHSSGTGPGLPPEYVKATMISRLNTLLLGKSGVSKEVIQLLQEFINQDILPFIPEHGGVGASGDLVQLAHLGLCLIGEGYVTYDGTQQPTAEVMKAKNLEPVTLKLRDGLALINGTSCMTGIGMINLSMAKKLLRWSIQLGALLNELVDSYDDSFSAELNMVKLHPGQNQVAQAMREFLEDSRLIKKREDHLFKNIEIPTSGKFNGKVQEYYSLRCIPQILGAVKDTIDQVEKVLVDELNSANDNPIVDINAENVFHGGNFHGDYVSLEMDKLRLVVTKMTMLVERQLNFLLNSRLNEKFPPFLNMGKLGFNFGFQGMQFTATSTTAENQTLSNSMYVHSISCNNDNQDIVSMGTNSALLTKKVIENAFQVLAIQTMACMQAVDVVNKKPEFAALSRKFYDDVRSLVPPFSDDQPGYEKIDAITQFLKTKDAYISV